jgi:hypothetical protein
MIINIKFITFGRRSCTCAQKKFVLMIALRRHFTQTVAKALLLSVNSAPGQRARHAKSVCRKCAQRGEIFLKHHALIAT